MAAGQIYLKTGNTSLFFRNGSDVEVALAGADAGTSTTAGKLWVSGAYLYYQPTTGNTRRLTGSLVAAGQSPYGRIYLESSLGQLRYIGTNGGLYRLS